MSSDNCTAISSGSIRFLLRSKIATDHAAVDARFAKLIARGPRGYPEFLRLSAAAICPLEQALFAANVERILPDWGERARGASLLADLADFGIADVSVAQPPVLGGEAHQLGVLYVLEGSRLGAKVLIQRLLKDSELVSLSAHRYLRHGEGRPLWQTFVKRLESSEAVRRAPADAVAGAHAAFAYFGADVAVRSAPAGV